MRSVESTRPGTASLILTNAKITVSARTGETVEALAVAGDRVMAIGTNAEIEALASPGTVVIDAGGRRVVPGLIDSHIHLIRAGRLWHNEVRWDEFSSLEEGLAAIRAATQRLEQGDWICVVGGFHPHQFKEDRPPTRAELDAAAPEHAVYVQNRYDGAVLNSLALDRCGITADTPDPEGGRFERDADGRPTGVVIGIPAFNYCLNHALDRDFEYEVNSTIEMLADLSRYGLTGGIDMGGLSRMSVEVYRVMQEVRRRGAMSMRVRSYIHPFVNGRETTEIEQYVKYLHPQFGDDYLKMVGMGEIVQSDWYDSGGETPLTITEEMRERLLRITRLLVAHNWPMNMHAVRNDSLSAILDVWEEVDKETPLEGRRFSISHGDTVSPENMSRLARLGAGITVQHWAAVEAAERTEAWGEAEVVKAPPMKSMLQAGLVVGGGTDAMVVAASNPWRSLQWMVDGRSLDGGPDRVESERLTRAEALEAYTLGSAWFGFDDARLGSLEVGKLADLAVLSADYFAVPEAEIGTITSLLTLLGGRAVHAVGEFAAFHDPVG